MQLFAYAYILGGLLAGAFIHPAAALAWYGTPVVVNRLR